MEILGIGPLEILFILIIALIILGPKDMVKAGKTLGRWMRAIVMSPTWRTIQQTSRELRYLPNKLMREAGMDDLQKSLPNTAELRKDIGLDKLEQDVREWQKDISDWTTPPVPGASPTLDPGEPLADESPASSAASDEDQITIGTPATPPEETQGENSRQTEKLAGDTEPPGPDTPERIDQQ